MEKVDLYCKKSCCWTVGVKEVLDRYGITYKEIDVSDVDNFDYMKKETNQPFSPTLLIDGEWLVDVGGKELETYLNTNGNYKGMME